MSLDATTTAAACDLLVSLPPMTLQAWQGAQKHLRDLLLGSSAAAVDAAAERRAQAQCHQGAGVAPVTSSQFQHIETRLQDYQTKRYPTSDSTVLVVRCRVEEEVLDEKSSNYDSTCSTANATAGVLRTYCEHLDPSNCLAGSLTGEWHVRIVTEQTAELRGTLRWHAHYYEESNVQTRSTREYPITLVTTVEEKVNAMVKQFEKEQMSYEEQLARALVLQVERWEQDFYTALAGMEEAPDLVRPLRRILPITKTRFKWDSAAQRNVQLLNARKKL